MALSKGVNSYGTVAEADAYFEDRLDVAAWTVAVEAEKAKALVTATSMIDGLEYIGVAVSESQALTFPKTGECYFDPRLSMAVSLSADTVPNRVIKATFEQAYHLLNNDGLLDDTGSVKSLNIGGVELSEIRATPRLSAVVSKLLKPLLLRQTNRMVWRAN